MIKIVGDKELDIDISDLELEERYDSELYKTTTLFFIGPKEILNDKYPEAESTEISVEFITEDPYKLYPEIMISPTKDGEDYDWNYLYIDDPDVVNKLISIGLNLKEKIIHDY